MYNKEVGKSEDFFMRENILVFLAVLIVISMFFCQNKTNRYEVVTGANMLTILVDKETGLTWRNCVCGDKSNVPGCWEKMYTLNPESFNKPIGEDSAVKKMIKLQKKQMKLQENMQQPEQK